MSCIKPQRERAARAVPLDIVRCLVLQTRSSHIPYSERSPLLSATSQMFRNMKAIYRIGIQKIVAPEHDIRVIAAGFLDKGGISGTFSRDNPHLRATRREALVNRGSLGP
jgi:hypothetical protein